MSQRLRGKGVLRMPDAEEINLELFLMNPSSQGISICKKLSTVVILFILILKCSTASSCSVITICRLGCSLNYVYVLVHKVWMSSVLPGILPTAILVFYIKNVC